MHDGSQTNSQGSENHLDSDSALNQILCSL
jgi:hypothetical protein